MLSKISEFFEPVKVSKYIGRDDYTKAKSNLKALKAVSKICDLSYYIIDYYRREFFYVSTNPLFLSGYSQEEVLEMGYEFYGVCIHPEDLPLLSDLNKAGFKFFYQLPVERREHVTISYNLRLKNKDTCNYVMLNSKVAPLFLTDDGNIWMAICLVTLSSKHTPGNVHIITKDDQTRYGFNREEQIFEKTELKKLTKKEIEILKQIALGNDTEEISGKLEVSTSTVKNHKTRIFRKLNVKTSAEAVFVFANSQGIL